MKKKKVEKVKKQGRIFRLTICTVATSPDLMFLKRKLNSALNDFKRTAKIKKKLNKGPFIIEEIHRHKEKFHTTTHAYVETIRT